MPLNPLVSVVVPVYNAESYVGEAVRSALDQPETGEVLLIEDASPDDSLAVCERLAAEHERVTLLRHPGGENRGAAASRNLGVAQARFPYVAFLDADDYYLPGRFTKALSVLEADAAVDGVYDAVRVRFDTEEMRVWWENKWASSGSPLARMYTFSEAPAPEELLAAFCGRGSAQGAFHTNGITARRAFFERVGLFPPELRMSQDTAMWLKMAAVGRLAAGSLEEPVAVHRLHGENRMFRDEALNQRYELQARSHVFEWAIEQRLGREALRLLVEPHLHYERERRAAERRRKRFALRDLPWLIALGARAPAVAGNAYYWRYVAESVYIPLDVAALSRAKRLLLRRRS